MRKILSLDGGGSWALLQARALGVLYGPDAPGHTILKNFDLVAANSGGSIVLGALAANFSPKQINDLFHSKVTTIFVERSPSIVRCFWRTIGLDARWSTEQKLVGLRAAFKDALGSKTLPQVQASVPGLPHFLISSFDYDRQRVRFFRSNLQSMAGSQDRPSFVPSFVEAIHAASTAPVLFFNAPAMLTPRNRFWDGAIAGYNNPIAAAVVEERANHPSEQWCALSLGTGQVMLPLPDPAKTAEWARLIQEPEEPGVKHDLKEMAMSIVDDPPDAASFVAHVMLGGRLPLPATPPVTEGPVIRLSPLVQPWLDPTGTIWTRMLPPDQDPTFERLRGLAMDATKPEEIAAIDTLCDAWLAGRSPNQGIRTTRDLQIEIGHRRFADGHAAAQRLGLA